MISAAATGVAFDREFRRVFEAEFATLFRYANRWCGDPALAAEVAQATFVRLHRRRRLPEQLRAWLVSIANGMLRDGRHGAVRPGPVRAALDGLPPLERALLLLRHEGYSYRDLAKALQMRESSVGLLLARAREQFRAATET